MGDASRDGWATGDMLAFPFPAHPAAFRDAGADWLTAAFRRTGAIGADDAVTAVADVVDVHGGSTGAKLMLRVAYSTPGPPADLFVKFSRAFDDPVRDVGRTQMATEARFGLVSRDPAFPIAVPACLFADYEAATGTGILVTERVPFGREGIEPHREKCLDADTQATSEHYAAMLTAIARLAGADRAGRLSGDVARDFPFEIDALSVGEKPPYSAGQVTKRVERYAAFAAAHPGLLPDNVRTPAFLARLAAEAPRVPALMPAIKARLAADPPRIAFCHWNANIDNAWFHREADGTLVCGLMDWGCVSRMNVGMAIWGAMSGAEASLWDEHLDDLLALFVREYAAAGGPSIDIAALEDDVMLYVATMGIEWMLDAPGYIAKLVPDLADCPDRFDPRIRGSERPRNQLQILTNVMNLWDRRDFGAVLARFEAERTISAAS